MSTTSYAAEAVAKRFGAFSCQAGRQELTFKLSSQFKEELKCFIRESQTARESIRSCRIAYAS